MAQNAFRPRLVKFETDRILSSVREAKVKALRQVAREMEAKIKQAIGTQGPPRSTPGNAPHKDTGFLHDKVMVVATAHGITVRVPQYGIWLEGGTSKMDPRPFIRSTVGGANGKKWLDRVAVLVKKFKTLKKIGL